jgi:hypothetical protein
MDIGFNHKLVDHRGADLGGGGPPAGRDRHWFQSRAGGVRDGVR